jgi:plasmid maintenance system antidote protein VapI
MTDAGKPIPFDPDWTMRPGVTLREMLDDSGMSVRVIAKIAGLAPAVIQGVLDGSVPITEPIAERLARALTDNAMTAQFWCNLEAAYWDGLAAGKKDLSDEMAGGEAVTND